MASDEQVAEWFDMLIRNQDHLNKLVEKVESFESRLQSCSDSVEYGKHRINEIRRRVTVLEDGRGDQADIVEWMFRKYREEKELESEDQDGRYERE